MYGETLYNLYAPPESVWSPWVKPVLFSQMRSQPAFELGEAWEGPSVDYVPPASERCAVILEIPAHFAIVTALALVRKGYRPVPLFNCCTGPAEIIDVAPIFSALAFGGQVLQRNRLPPDAPPVFILDSARCPQSPPPAPGRFDNRWIVLPQDFPSAHMLRSQNIRRAVVVQNQPGQPDEDLAHVLLRWQEGGIQIQTANAVSGSYPLLIKVSRPRRFRSFLYTLLAMTGLRRNSAGGFGSVVPQPSESSYGGG